MAPSHPKNPSKKNHLLVELSNEHGMTCPGFTEEAQTALKQHRWPGNVRELRNVVEQALVRAGGHYIDVPDLPPPLCSATTKPLGDATSQPDPLPLNLDQTLADVERHHIEAVLEHYRWNRSAAAKVLGIDRRTLYSKIRKYGLVTPRG